MLAKLSENEQKLFEQVYKQHVNTMGSEERKEYGRERCSQQMSKRSFRK